MKRSHDFFPAPRTGWLLWKYLQTRCIYLLFLQQKLSQLLAMPTPAEKKWFLISFSVSTFYFADDKKPKLTLY